MNNNQPLNSKITTIHLFTLAVQVIWGKIAKIKTYYIEACRLPSKSGTNVKSVETALGTWGSYHLYIYNFYISQEISSFPFYKTFFFFFPFIYFFIFRNLGISFPFYPDVRLFRENHRVLCGEPSKQPAHKKLPKSWNTDTYPKETL